MDIALATPHVFNTLRAEWNDLLSRSASNNVFLRWEWIHVWWTNFGAKKQPVILTARRDGRLVGIAPLYLHKSHAWGVRSLSFCSSDLVPDYMDFIAERDDEAAIVRALVAAVFEQHREWDILSLNSLRSGSALLSDPSLFARYPREVRLEQHCPYIEIKGTFADYYESRTALSRFDIPKKLTKLREQMHVTHVQAQDKASVSKGLDDLFALHEKRAAGKQIHSNFSADDIKTFHHELAQKFLREGILNLQLLYNGPSPVSATYAFNYGNKTCVYQTGFDPGWSKWSVGAVLFYLGIEKAFKEGATEYDFLKGNEPYKSQWATAQHDVMHMTIYNKTLRGMILYGCRQLKSALSKIKRALTGM